MLASKAATFERRTDLPEPAIAPGGRTAPNWPPTYMTPLANAIARTAPSVCQERFGGFAATACPGVTAPIAVATAPIRSARRTAGV